MTEIKRGSVRLSVYLMGELKLVISAKSEEILQRHWVEGMGTRLNEEIGKEKNHFMILKALFAMSSVPG